MTKEELIDKITTWESEAGESFNDYFSHSSIDSRHWSTYLLKLGFKDVVYEILKESGNNERGWCFDQELMFDIYPSYIDDKWSEENADKNLSILVDYFFENPKLLQEAIDFLNQEEF